MASLLKPTEARVIVKHAPWLKEGIKSALNTKNKRTSQSSKTGVRTALKELLRSERSVSYMKEIADPVLSNLQALIPSELENGRVRSENFSHRVLLLVDEEHVYIGVEVYHGLPPAFIPAGINALSPFLAQGKHEGILAAFVLDGLPRKRNLLNPIEAEQLIHHLHPGPKGALVIGLPHWSAQKKRANGKWLSPSFGFRSEDSRSRDKIAQRAPDKLPSLWRVGENVDFENIPRQTVERFFKEVVFPALGNSTSEGSPPASKAHSAGGIVIDSTGQAWFLTAVNMRSPQWPQVVYCAESALVGSVRTLAAVLGDASLMTLRIVFLYSPDYKQVMPQGRGFPAPCKFCQERLVPVSPDADPERMVIYSSNGQGGFLEKTLRQCMDTSHTAQEQGIERGIS